MKKKNYEKRDYADCTYYNDYRVIDTSRSNNSNVNRREWNIK